MDMDYSKDGGRKVIRDILREVRENEFNAAHQSGSLVLLIMILVALTLMAICNLPPAEAAGGKAMTKAFEGFRAKPYTCAVGVKSVGYGFNIEAHPELVPDDVLSGKRGLTRREADRIFEALYTKAEADARAYLGAEVFDRLNPTRRDIIVDMSYNLGPDKLAGFKRLKAAIVAGDYQAAAREMQDSRWFQQVGRRGSHHVALFGEVR